MPPTAPQSPARRARKYTITSAALGATIRFEVTASDTAGKNTATSNPDCRDHDRHGRAGEQLPAGDIGQRHGRHHADDDHRLVGRRPADHVLLPVAAMRQERQLLRFDLRRNEELRTSSPRNRSATRFAVKVIAQEQPRKCQRHLGSDRSRAGRVRRRRRHHQPAGRRQVRRRRRCPCRRAADRGDRRLQPQPGAFAHVSRSRSRSR